MKHQKLSKTMLGILTIGMFLLTGCSFNPDFGIPPPVVSDGNRLFLYPLSFQCC